MRATAIALVVGVLLFLPAAAQQPEKLGTVNFPTSCSAAAQSEFTRAVALLHSFWFSYAIKGFEAAVQADPTCGIAAWGAAVSWLGNPLAGPPPPQNVELGAAPGPPAKAIAPKTHPQADYLPA